MKDRSSPCVCGCSYLTHFVAGLTDGARGKCAYCDCKVYRSAAGCEAVPSKNESDETPPPNCRCGHMYLSHRFDSFERGACTRSGCDCKRYLSVDALPKPEPPVLDGVETVVAHRERWGRGPQKDDGIYRVTAGPESPEPKEARVSARFKFVVKLSAALFAILFAALSAIHAEVGLRLGSVAVVALVLLGNLFEHMPPGRKP